MKLIVDTVPAPEYEPDHPLQAQVTTLTPRLRGPDRALPRAPRHHQAGPARGLVQADGTTETVTITNLYITESLERLDADEAGPGEIIGVAASRRSPLARRWPTPRTRARLPVISVDERRCR